uniref:Uncharacterized protein n=1 Tax=Tetraselmis chuii TaxID=63592 RepID=A0A7S1SLZ6_9CHLO|mmetsp:Transcript_15112/g.26755  ORF Transcript_15112/g.26755 Transcript_15112/m.26755 type:complete len:199 (+) Transcript_15112:114-710(+)
MDIDTGPAPLASSTSAPSTASGSQPAGNSQRSGGGGAGQAGQRLTGTPLVTLRALSARARALPLGQKLRPRPLHALLAGIEGRLRYRDAEERPLQQYQFEVYLDDGSAKQRCRVASEVVQRWLQGVDAPGLAAMSESARNVAVSKLKQFLMKAEGMWALEFNGGTGSLPLVVDMTPGLDGQLVAALRARCRLYYPSIS